jgi:hypothetical protein
VVQLPVNQKRELWAMREHNLLVTQHLKLKAKSRES